MATGSVKWFNTQKGFGFIAPDGGDKDVFVHVSALERSGVSFLHEGQKVEFEVGRDRKGRVAVETLKVVD
jgi:CspA family cold shock protein